MSDLKRSWITSANSESTDFPLNNLPYGVFSVDDGDLRCGVAIGDRIIDATGLEQAGHLRADPEADVLDAPYWNDFMELGARAWSAYRAALTEMLAEGADEATQDIITTFSVPMAEATLHLPFRVAEYTDFYAGRHHATNVGTMFRGAENALPPNWLHIPIGYNGRASSVVVSGTEIRRPWGQLKSPDHDTPIFAPSRRFDIELELGAIVGTPSEGPLTVDQADANIFGYVLLNDWSARDIQAWEYQPLGPFQAKATATTISPWIVTAEALRPFRVSTPEREVPLLPHLADTTPMNHDIALAVSLNGEEIARTNADELYYSAAQQLAHHASAGSPMRAGDLLGSGTISGPEKENRGSLLELSWGGKEPLETASGPRSFIEDNDTLALHGASHGNGYRIGFGPCEGEVIPAAEDPFTG
ncbi:fumarylacetoacetase [Gymnodinialimonas ceratoperidinii]|uniref:fumarylacetoacetase n=1 Tax=Gymnodinialimonas ceratoperidinii TaxID=2856823 RepID=A0A8F6TUP4_9RHOB|nr:fumarylacetoacetase [Gymnodinialimonas ceratoperidinii]QXT39015.1 fumarylacetoacetase [Gymnodinialimonas ceratoperidinii]